MKLHELAERERKVTRKLRDITDLVNSIKRNDTVAELVYTSTRQTALNRITNSIAAYNEADLATILKAKEETIQWFDDMIKILNTDAKELMSTPKPPPDVEDEDDDDEDDEYLKDIVDDMEGDDD